MLPREREEIARTVADTLDGRLGALERQLAAALDAQHSQPPRVAFSPSECAAAIGCDRATVYRLIDAGTLTAARVGGRLYVRTDALIEFLRDHEPGAVGWRVSA